MPFYGRAGKFNGKAEARKNPEDVREARRAVYFLRSREGK